MLSPEEKEMRVTMSRDLDNMAGENDSFLKKILKVNDSISIAVVFYKNFSAFLPERFLAQYGYGYGSILHRGLDMEYQLHSRIVAVAVQTGQRVVGARSSRLKVKARLAHLNHTVNRQIMWNISCGVADFSQG
ncbi:GPS domain-containing protein [Trichonephila clavipes]|nr:GPS domain-containing protein [Trichonephila clavipes]